MGLRKGFLPECGVLLDFPVAAELVPPLTTHSPHWWWSNEDERHRDERSTQALASLISLPLIGNARDREWERVVGDEIRRHLPSIQLPFSR